MLGERVGMVPPVHIASPYHRVLLLRMPSGAMGEKPGLDMPIGASPGGAGLEGALSARAMGTCTGHANKHSVGQTSLRIGAAPRTAGQHGCTKDTCVLGAHPRVTPKVGVQPAPNRTYLSDAASTRALNGMNNPAALGRVTSGYQRSHSPSLFHPSWACSAVVGHFFNLLPRLSGAPSGTRERRGGLPTCALLAGTTIDRTWSPHGAYSGSARFLCHVGPKS